MEKRLKKRLEARPGIGLPMALIIILIGSVLVTFMFNAAANFMLQTTRQQENYLIHAYGASYIGKVRGMISDQLLKLYYNPPANGVLVLHRDDYVPHRDNPDDDRFKIKTSADLLILDKNIDLNFEEKLTGVSDLTARVRVFDVSHKPENLDREFLTSGGFIKDSTALTRTQRDTLAEMPPPLTLLNIETDDDGFKVIGQEDPIPTPNNDPKKLDLDKVGMYVIRAELLNDRGELVRFFEQAFFQVASPDTSGS